HGHQRMRNFHSHCERYDLQFGAARQLDGVSRDELGIEMGELQSSRCASEIQRSGGPVDVRCKVARLAAAHFEIADAGLSLNGWLRECTPQVSLRGQGVPGQVRS